MAAVIHNSSWSVIVRGLLAILFGIVALLWPGITLISLVSVFGIFAIVDGIAAIYGSLSSSDAMRGRWGLLVIGVVSIIAGIVAFLYPGITAISLALIIGAWALIGGIVEIATAIQLRDRIENEWSLILAGVLSALFGILVLAAPGAGALSLVWLIGLFAIAYGVMRLIYGTRAQELGSDMEGRRISRSRGEPCVDCG